MKKASTLCGWQKVQSTMLARPTKIGQRDCG
jgi:hypothetical protein